MRRLATNFLVILGSDITRRVLGFLSVAYLARNIDVAGFGIINIAYALLSYALMASSGGLNTFGSREIARGAPTEFVNHIMSLRIIGALIVLVAVCVGAATLVSSHILAVLIVLMCLALLPHAVLLEWYFQGKEEMGTVALGRCISALMYLGVILLLVHAPGDVFWVAIAAVAGDTVSSLLLLFFYRRRCGRIRFRFTADGWRETLSRAYPLGAGAILAHVSVNLPPILVGLIMTSTDVGVFSAASKLVVLLLMIDRVIGTLLLPASARLHAASPESLTATLNLALRWILIVSLPVSVGCSLLAGRLVPLVFGQQYESSIVVFQVLVWYFLLTMIHTVYTSGIIAVHKEREYGRVMMISACIYGASITMLTILFGVVGAAAAVVCSEAVTLVLMRREFHRTVRTVFPRTMPQILSAAIAMGLLLFILPSISLPFMVLIGAVVYGAVLVVTRAVTAADVTSLLHRA